MLPTGVIIGFSTYKHPTVMAKVIRYFDETEYTHVYTRFMFEDKKSIVYQSMIDDDPIRDFNEFKSENRIIKEYCVLTNKFSLNLALKYCQDNSHKKYSILKLFGIWLARNFVSSNPFRNRELEHYCVEYVGGVLSVLGHRVPNLDTCSPANIDTYLGNLSKVNKDVFKL